MAHALKIIAMLAVLVAVVYSQHSHQDQHDYADHHPKYQYQYSVHDGHTQDVKKHVEMRDGDKTEGEYSLLDADGTTRTVKYMVHGKSGFVATVHRSGHPAH